MVDRVETDGWLRLYSGSDTVLVYCESVKYRLVKKGKIIHLDAGVNLFIPVFKQYVEVQATGLWINTNAKIVNYQLYLSTWLNSGSINVKIQRDTSSNFEKMDGTNTIFPMAVKNDLGFIEKIGKGDQTIYYVEKLVLEQTGTAS